MELKNLFTEERGVSPVIGVILMVAITVILAAVIGAFVLGLGDQASSSAPQAQFSFSYDNVDDGVSGEGDPASEITVSHSGGQDVDTSELEIRVDGVVIYDRGSIDDGGEVEIDDNEFIVHDVSPNWEDDIISTGDREKIQLEENGEDGDRDELDGKEVTIVWVNPGGSSSNTIATSRWSA